MAPLRCIARHREKESPPFEKCFQKKKCFLRGKNDFFLFLAVRSAAAQGGWERKGAPHIVSFAQVLYI
jgi:hypothetical protein